MGKALAFSVTGALEYGYVLITGIYYDLTPGPQTTTDVEGVTLEIFTGIVSGASPVNADVDGCTLELQPGESAASTGSVVFVYGATLGISLGYPLFKAVGQEFIDSTPTWYALIDGVRYEIEELSLYKELILMSFVEVKIREAVENVSVLEVYQETIYGDVCIATTDDVNISTKREPADFYSKLEGYFKNSTVVQVGQPYEAISISQDVIANNMNISVHVSIPYEPGNIIVSDGIYYQVNRMDLVAKARNDGDISRSQKLFMKSITGDDGHIDADLIHSN